MKRAVIAFITVLLMFAFAACGGDNVPDEQAEQGSIMIFENYGRTVEVEETPSAVVTIGPNCTELFIALGLDHLVVGNCCDNHSQGPLPEFAEAYDRIPELTYGYPTMEAVVGSGADFVYAIDWAFSGDFTVEALESYGIDVYMCAATDYQQLWQEITDLGRIFGVEEAAAEYVRGEKQKIAVAEAVAAGRPPQRVLVFDAGGDTVYTAGAPNLETLLLETAGGENIFVDMDKAWGAVSYEEVLARDPQWIVVHDYDVPTARDKIAEICSNSILAQLECVQQERFIIIPLECALAGPRTGYTAELFAQALWGE